MPSREIKLTRGQVAFVDEEDYERIAAYKWYALWYHHTRSFYAVRKWRDQQGKDHIVSMQREILGLVEGDPKYADHIQSGQTLMNTRGNLRIVTPQQNCCNARRRRDNISGFKGVSWNNRRRKWRATISNKGNLLELGFFIDKEDAALEYNKKALQLHREFATLNFPNRKVAV